MSVEFEGPSLSPWRLPKCYFSFRLDVFILFFFLEKQNNMAGCWECFHARNDLFSVCLWLLAFIFLSWSLWLYSDYVSKDSDSLGGTLTCLNFTPPQKMSVYDNATLRSTFISSPVGLLLQLQITNFAPMGFITCIKIKHPSSQISPV